MKYKLKNLKDSEVIKKYTISDKVIAVEYLDSTVDYFPNTKDVENKIIKIMKEQASEYIKKEEEISFSSIGYTIKGGFSLAGSAAFILPSITDEPNCYLVGVGVILASTAFVELLKRGASKRELNYLLKLKKYLANQEKLGTNYEAILREEENLGIHDMPKKITINNIDSINSKTVSLAVEKCKRYPKIHTRNY